MLAAGNVFESINVLRKVHRTYGNIDVLKIWNICDKSFDNKNNETNNY